MHKAITWRGRRLGTWALYGFYIPANITCDICFKQNQPTLMRVPFNNELTGSTRYCSAENPVWRSK